MQKHEKKRNVAHMIVSALSFVALLCVMCTSLVSCKEDFSYLESDLSEYVTISEADYKNYIIELPDLSVSESDVERKIMGLLTANRAKEPSNDGAQVFRVPITLGDDVYIYYRGYTVDENGIQTDVENTSNLFGSAYKLTVGSLAFVEGFEEGILGAVPWDHHFDPEYNLLTSGKVSEDDIIYVTYTVMMPDGTSASKINERINLSDDGIDARYGEGFSSFFEGGNVEIGKKISSHTFSSGGGTVVYCDMTVSSAIRSSKPPLTIETKFPYDYSEPSLRGQCIMFDVYFNGAFVYDTPEYNESFITEVLKLDEDKLSEYDGGIVAKHRSYLEKEIEKEKSSLREFIIEEKIWEHYRACATVKKLPDDKVEESYKAQYNQILNEYRIYSKYYQSVEQYAYSVYGYTDLKATLTEEARQIVTEKVIFYYIIRQENLLPSDTEYDELYDKLVAEHLDYFLNEIYDDELAGLKTEEEKQARIAEIKEEMMDYYGEEYFEELVYYDFAYDTVKGFAEIKG